MVLKKGDRTIVEVPIWPFIMLLLSIGAAAYGIQDKRAGDLNVLIQRNEARIEQRVTIEQYRADQAELCRRLGVIEELLRKHPVSTLSPNPYP